MTDTGKPWLQLQIETTNVCDAACQFCPYPTMKRGKGAMSMDLFRKIVDESATIPQIQHLTFTGLGETLLDKHLIERIRYARSKMPDQLIDIYSNGSQLTREKIDALIDAGLSVLYVSLNGVNADKRNQIMYHHKPGYNDFDRVCEMLDYAIERHKNGTSNMKVVVKTIVSKDLMEVGEAEIFEERWGGRTSAGGNAFLHLEGNWAGAMYPVRVVPSTPCSRALQQIMVLWDGRVSLCCFDGEGQEILGDLNTHGIRDVFNGDKATKIREDHWNGRRSESSELCRNCTAI